jgi:hypothetical protein
MKKFLLAVIAILVVGITSVQADESKVSKRVLEAFKIDYANAESTSWEKVGDLYRVKFKFHNQTFTSFYDRDGELISTSRIIHIDQTPIAVQTALSERYPNASIQTDVIETIQPGGATQYFVNAATPKKQMVLQCGSSGDILVFKSIKTIK